MNKEKLRKEYREKFGQFYVSIHKDGTPRLVDTEGGERVIATDDGQELKVFASTTQENWWLEKLSLCEQELWDKCEEMKKSSFVCPLDEGEGEYNSALSDIQEIIKQK